MPASDKRLMLLDTASMYFRAFYGVPEIGAPDGTNVNAVRGLMDFISRLVDEYHPTDLVCCWDNDWRPQWRVDLIPSYKGHRVVEEVASAPDVEEVPDPLEAQIPIIVDVLDAFGICVMGADGYEADDVIGTLATEAGQPVDIVTGDRDLFQLVDDEPTYGSSTSPAAWAGTSGSPTTGCARSTASTPISTPTSPRCGVTRPTGCPESRASGRRPPRRCWGASATSPASSPPPTTPSPRWARARAARSRPPPTTSEVAPTVVAVARDIDLDRSNILLPRQAQGPRQGRGAGRAVGPRQSAPSGSRRRCVAVDA